MAGKLCWALGLVLLFAAAVLTQAPLAVGLLGFFLLLTLLLVLEVRYLRGKVEAELIVPDQPAVQGRPFVLTVRLTNHSPLPIPQLLTLVQATDQWGGNTITLRCSGMLGSKARAEQRLTLQANKSGVWQLRLQSVTLWDHLGLFKAQCGLPQTAQSLCVLPQSARLGSDTQPDPDADGMQESDRSVLGGNYDVREYREGDSLKQVHWKLSAKLNRLLIREPLAAGTMAGQGSGDGPGEGEGDMWGDFPAEAALHREAPPTKKKAVALSKRGGTDADSGLVFLDRVLISPAVPARDTLWLVVDLCLLLALGLILYEVSGQLNLDFPGLVHAIRENEHSRIFVFDDWHSKQNFFKQFFSGIFITIVMTGLDQDMMQKNLSCKNLREAQKNMYCYGISFVPVNFLFLSLGILLLLFASQLNIPLPAAGDEILPLFAAEGHLGFAVLIFFTIGIIAAAFSSADSALTALTTSFCIDIAGISHLSGKEAERRRKLVHFCISVLFIGFILLFKAVNNKSVIDAIYTIASYTYGPLLGLFAFGLFTPMRPRDRFVPYIAIASPLLCYAIDRLVFTSTGYQFGYEMLMFNGFLTFMGLTCLSIKTKNYGNTQCRICSK